MTTTILGWLTEETIEDAAGSGAFNRGKKISSADVTILSDTESEVQAAVQGTWTYRTTLFVQGDRVGTTCDCPVGTQWCKHAVAVALALLIPNELSFDDSAVTDSSATSNESTPDAVDTYLDSVSPDELRRLIHHLRQIPEVEEMLEFNALKSSGDDKQVREHVKSAITAASRKSSGFRDYWQSMELARHWSDALDVVEAYVDEHRGVAVRPQIERAITRLNAVLGRADDSSGMLGDELHRCFDLHARACADGVEDQQKLAKWLVKETLEAPFLEPDLRAYAGLLSADAVESIAAAFEANPPKYGAKALFLDVAFLRGDDDQIESMLLDGNSVKDLIEFYESRGRKDEVKAVLSKWDTPIHWNEIDFFENRLRAYLGDKALLDYRIEKFKENPGTVTFDRVIHGPGVTEDVIDLIPEGIPGRDVMLLQAAMRFNDPELGLSVVDGDEVDVHSAFEFARSVLSSHDPERALEIMLREPEHIARASGDRAYKQAAASATQIIDCFPADPVARKAVLEKMEELAIRYKNRPKMLKIWRNCGLIS